jgi:4-amino-4-deoxychorismate lyase
MSVNNATRFPFFETIKYDQGRCHLVPYHLERMQRTLLAQHGASLQFVTALEYELTSIQQQGLHKVKVYYNANDFKVEVIPYHARMPKQIHLIPADEISYEFKFTNRKILDDLKGSYEDILICKQQYLTDTSYANVALWNGEEWHTPNTPLLLGVKRSYYINQGILRVLPIGVQDLNRYQKISLINAMLDLNEVVLPIGQLIL